MFLKLWCLLMGLSLGMCLRLNLSLKTDAKIHQLHSDSMVLAETHRDYSAYCFPKYNPQLNSIVNQYETQYAGCISQYDASDVLIDNTFKNIRLQMESSAYSSCKSLKSCNQSANTYLLFECASAKAAEDAKIFYDISANATDAAAKSKAEYRRVETTKDLCVQEAERNYVENTSNVYGKLNACLIGNEPASPVWTTEDPDWTTEDPDWTTEGPRGTTEGPRGTTEGPRGTTEDPDWTTKDPKWTTERVAWTTPDYWYSTTE